MHSNLRRLDLNLLLIFDALYRHRSVVLAADELFVRAGHAMQPTAQARSMAEGVQDALRILSDRLAGASPFQPETSTQTFVFAATDYTACALLPTLVARLEAVAPHVRIKVIHASHQDSLDELREGRIHFALGVAHGPTPLPEGVKAIDCLSDDYVVVMRAGHPRCGASLSLPHYLAERHVAALPWEAAFPTINLP